MDAVLLSRPARRRWLRAWLVAVCLGAMSLFLAAPAAHAESGDRMDAMSADLRVDAQGVVHVTESFTWRFGSASGRHGVLWSVVTRERYDDQHDQLYHYDNIKVTSPDAGVSTKWSSSTSSLQDGRLQQLTWRIGSSDVTISAPTARYTISYDLRGALRHFDSYDELYWDILGDNSVPVDRLTVTASVPGGVLATTCNAGAVHTQGGCTSQQVSNGVAHFAANGVTGDDFVTVSTKIGAGLVSNPRPELVERADHQAQVVGRALGWATPLALLVPGLFGWVVARRQRDDRFVGLPPGVLPDGQANTQVGPSAKVQVPVSFSPPRLPLADAGQLLDASVGAKALAATVVQLATQGAVAMGGSGKQAWVQVVDPSRVVDAYQRTVMDALFPGGSAGERTELGQRVDLGTAGEMHAATVSIGRQALETSRTQGWFKRLPGPTMTGGCASLLLVMGVLTLLWVVSSAAGTALGALGTGAWLFGAALVVGCVVAFLMVWNSNRRGSRTAVGRALTDQVEGFRTYIATAEAEQLRFEEGEDIYSRYLPWAVLFGLTQRWATVCARLVELGRLSAQPPSWYAGDPYLWNYYWFNDQVGHVTTAASPQPPSSGGSGSGTGWGGGDSSFSSGGFSGGGGGGTSAGSW